MKISYALAVITGLVLAAPSHSQELAPMVFSCNTSSNGYQFSRDGLDPGLLKDLVINQCRQNGATNNAECSANVACNDGGYYPPFVFCNTSSNGYQFSDQCRDPSIARSETVRHCTESSATSNAECSANVACSGGPGPQPNPPMVTCTTSSNGYQFSDQSRDVALARTEAVRHCTDNSATNNAECSANVACNDGSYYPPMVTCGTSSNGYSFSDQSRDIWLARSEATRHCTDSSATNNAECSANVACNDGSYYPPMVTCSTYSNGYSFSDQSRDMYLARSEAIRHCTDNSATNNQECAANATCQAR